MVVSIDIMVIYGIFVVADEHDDQRLIEEINKVCFMLQ